MGNWKASWLLRISTWPGLFFTGFNPAWQMCVCDKCVWQTCVTNVCDKCVWEMCVTNICDKYVCDKYVRDKYVWQMCVWQMCVTNVCVTNVCVSNVCDKCVWRGVHVCDMLMFICVTCVWHAIHMCDLCVTWYGVATISRLRQITGLF